MTITPATGLVTIPPDPGQTNLHGKAEQALVDNATFLAIASPTNAQVTAQVKKLTRQTNALIRLTLGRLESNTDT